MVNKCNNTILINQANHNNELTDGIVLVGELNCVGLYKNPMGLEDLENNEDLCDCNILEIIADFSIDIKNFMNLIKKASFRLFDMTYATDGFHFLVRNVRDEEV